MSYRERWPTEQDIDEMIRDKFGAVFNITGDENKQALIATREFVFSSLRRSKMIGISRKSRKSWLDHLNQLAGGYFEGYLDGIRKSNGPKN